MVFPCVSLGRTGENIRIFDFPIPETSGGTIFAFVSVCADHEGERFGGDPGKGEGGLEFAGFVYRVGSDESGEAYVPLQRQSLLEI